MIHLPLLGVSMRMLLIAVLSMIHADAPTVGDAPSVIDAVAWAVSTDPMPPFTGDRATDASVEIYYAWKESRLRRNPPPVAWDPRAGISCGALQMPCWFVRTHTLREQASEWLRWVHSRGLASVDSSRRRSDSRTRVAKRLLAMAIGEVPRPESAQDIP